MTRLNCDLTELYFYFFRIGSPSESSFGGGPMNNDEHSLIATYCQALTLQISERAAFLQSAGLGAGGGTTGDKSIELEEVLHKLNERNNSLQREYEALARLNGDSQV